MIKGVIFDADGTLVNSIDAHYDFFVDVAFSYNYVGCNLVSKRLEKVKTPIDEFARAVGFTENLIPEVVRKYKKDFHKYDTPLYDGVPDLLKKVSSHVKIALVSQNYRKILEKTFGRYWSLFSNTKTREDFSGGDDKAKIFMDVIAPWEIEPKEVIAVDDMSKYWEQTKRIGIEFLGVSYGGYDIRKDEKHPFPVINSIPNLEKRLLNLIRGNK